jgi:predicted dehydrogenase
MTEPTSPAPETPSRRQFLGTTAATATAATLAASLPFARVAYAAAGSPLKVALVGAGGRGTGAASQALTADSDTKLTAICDIFPDNIESSLKRLAETEVAGQVDPKIQKFDGFEGYKNAIHECDVVLLATSPYFRPMMVEEAVKQKKHMFVEKPVATDPVNVMRCWKAAEAAKAAGLAVVSGLCYRYEKAKQQVMEQIHGGAIGEIRSMHTYYYTTQLWHRGHKPQWSDMEYQIRNWLYFTWLSGDHIVEQHIHSYDKCVWANKDVYPVSAIAVGGRMQRTSEEYGNIYDSFAVSYEFENGVTLHSTCRQMNGCANDISDYIVGEKGVAFIQSHMIKFFDGRPLWRSKRVPKDSMYQNEHDELFKSIRAGKPIYNGDYMCKSTLMGIMGREAAYTGQKVTWDQMMNSKQDLSPAGGLKWGPNPVPGVAVPGVTKFV